MAVSFCSVVAKIAARMKCKESNEDNNEQERQMLYILRANRAIKR